MSVPLIPVVDPLNDHDELLPQDQLTAKLLVEDMTRRSVLPFEFEKQLVNRDHNDMQRKIWGDDNRHPVEYSTDGLKA